jgi:sugar phosphate isomerase/epimerase
MFSQGAFVNVLTPDSEQWKTTLKNLHRFPSLDHIELWLEHIPRASEIKEIRSAFHGIPLIVHGPFLQMSLVSHIPEIVAVSEKRFDAAIDFASKVEARVVTFHAGPYPLFETKEHVLEKLAGRFARFAELKDPVATLENMPIKSHGTTKEPIGQLSDCDEILKLLPNLRFTFDVGHCLQNADDFAPFLKQHSSKVENIHLHDGIPQGKGHLRLGTGSLELDRFLDVLMQVSFDKYVSMETISLDDTRSSWKTLCEAESRKGIRDIESVTQHELTIGGRHRATPE